MKLALVGCGFMGEAMLRAVIEKGVARADEVTVCEVVDERRAEIGTRYGVVSTGDPSAAADGTDIIVLAVKPQEFGAIASQMRGRLRREQIIVSIMAGVPVDKIARAFDHAGIVRVMPNTPAAVGEGMSVWTATAEVDASARERVGAILSAMGRAVRVDDEKYLDMATALSGSGPGFVYMLLEAFIDAGVHVGFKRDVAEMLALQTFLGSVKYAAVTGKHPAQLRNEVTSPAGTTAAGLLVLESAGVRAAIIDAVEAAFERSRELGA